MSNWVTINIPRNANNPNSEIIGVAVFDTSIPLPDGSTFLDPSWDNFVGVYSTFDPLDKDFNGEVSFGERLVGRLFPENFANTYFLREAYTYLGLETVSPNFKQLATGNVISMATDLTEAGVEVAYGRRAFGIDKGLFRDFVELLGETTALQLIDNFDGDYVPQFFVRQGRENIVVPHLSDFQPDPTPSDNLSYLTSSNFTANSSSGGGNYVVTVPKGDDASISTWNANDAVFAEDGDDSLFGGGGNDVLIGGAGEDTLDGGGGADTILGGADDDLLRVTTAERDFVEGDGGTDRLDIGWVDPQFNFSGTFYSQYYSFYDAGGTPLFQLANHGISAHGQVLADDTVANILQALSLVPQALATGRIGLGDTFAVSGPGAPDVLISGVEEVNIDERLGSGGTSLGLYLFMNGDTYVSADSGHFAADWSTQTTALDWDNSTQGIETLANGVTIGNMSRLTLLTGTGNDRVTGGASTDYLDGGDGNDTLDGGEGTDTLKGGAGDDVFLAANPTSDVIDGGAGDDLLQIGWVDPQFNFSGSYYSQYYTFYDATGKSLMQLGNQDISASNQEIEAGTTSNILQALTMLPQALANGQIGIGNTFAISGPHSPDVQFSNVERINIDERLGTGGTSLGLYLYMNGDTYVSAGSGHFAGDWSAQTTGVSWDIANPGVATLANGVTLGNMSQATLLLGTGEDTVSGGQKADHLHGGGGADTLRGGDGLDTLDGGRGTDLLFGEQGDDVMTGGDGFDNLRGGSGADTMDGGNGNDSLYGGTGFDSMLGGAGNDGNDTLYGGGTEADTLDGGRGTDLLFGEQGDDVMTGGDGFDNLRGGSGADTMDGGNGNDSLYGGTGFDSMSGGAGND
ncbi:MAG: hypothetical protein OIF48_11195, partial [Silicimonas sp.]|nr:hypothetical protein [Silicimonas sp.]